MRSREEHRDLQALHQLEGAVAGRVWSIVVEDDCVGPPFSIFLVEFEYQLPQEDFHNLVVGVGLHEGKVELACRVQANEHGDAGLDGFLWERVSGPILSPLHSAEVCHAQPGLVAVDDAFAHVQEPDQLPSELLAQHQVPLGVGVDCDLRYPAVLHAHLELENIGKEPRFLVNLVSLLQVAGQTGQGSYNTALLADFGDLVGYA